MDLRQLRYFLAVAETLSFTRAAVRLSVSQSSVSRRIAELEVELGQRLLDRPPQAVALTAPGRRLAVHARQILSQLELARIEVRALAGSGLPAPNVPQVALERASLLRGVRIAQGPRRGRRQG